MSVILWRFQFIFWVIIVHDSISFAFVNVVFGCFAFLLFFSFFFSLFFSFFYFLCFFMFFGMRAVT